MKKCIYILIIIFLSYGKGFAGSVDFLNTIEVDSMEKLFSPYFNKTFPTKEKSKIYENYFCEIPSRTCLHNSYFINSESKRHAHCAKLLFLHEELKAFGISTKNDTSIHHMKTRGYVTFAESSSAYITPLNLKFRRLQNLNTEEYFSESINPHYSKGFGIRLRI